MIVVVADVLGGAAERVGLVNPLQRPPDAAQRLLQRVGAKPRAVDREQLQQVEDGGPVLDRQPAVHIGFAGRQFRIEE